MPRYYKDGLMPEPQLLLTGWLLIDSAEKLLRGTEGYDAWREEVDRWLVKYREYMMEEIGLPPLEEDDPCCHDADCNNCVNGWTVFEIVDEYGAPLVLDRLKTLEEAEKILRESVETARPEWSFAILEFNQDDERVAVYTIDEDNSDGPLKKES
jgi:hypothetical protein